MRAFVEALLELPATSSTETALARLSGLCTTLGTLKYQERTGANGEWKPYTKRKAEEMLEGVLECLP